MAGGVGLRLKSQLVLFGEGGAGDDLLLGYGDWAGGGAIPGDEAFGRRRSLRERRPREF